MYRKVSLVPTHTLISAITAIHVRHFLNTRTQMHTGQRTNREMKMEAHPKAYMHTYRETDLERKKRRKRMGMKEQRQRAL